MGTALLVQFVRVFLSEIEKKCKNVSLPTLFWRAKKIMYLRCLGRQCNRKQVFDLILIISLKINGSSVCRGLVEEGRTFFKVNYNNFIFDQKATCCTKVNNQRIHHITIQPQTATLTRLKIMHYT